MNWVITVPKTFSWATYEREIASVADGSSEMNYKTRYFPKEMKPGDRCYVVHDGRVRGWMEITGLVDAPKAWRCTTTGATWPAGKYIRRSGRWHPTDGPEMTGFRGVRKYEG